MTSFNYLTFLHADINQSEVEDGFQLASDWIKSVRKIVNKSKAVWAPCLRLYKVNLNNTMCVNLRKKWKVCSHLISTR